MTAAPLTMACWANHATVAVGGIITIDSGAATHTFGIETTTASSQNRLRMKVADAGGAVTADGGTNLGTSTWNHLAGVFRSATDRESYVNGVSEATSATSRTPSGVNSFDIGRRRGALAYMNGQLAEVAVWDVDLTVAELLSLADGFCPLLVRPANLVAYVPLVKGATGTGGNERDVVGGLTLTDNGTVTVAAHPRIIYPWQRWLTTTTVAAGGDAVPQAWVQYRSRRVA